MRPLLPLLPRRLAARMLLQMGKINPTAASASNGPSRVSGELSGNGHVTVVRAPLTISYGK